MNCISCNGKIKRLVCVKCKRDYSVGEIELIGQLRELAGAVLEIGIPIYAPSGLARAVKLATSVMEGKL